MQQDCCGPAEASLPRRLSAVVMSIRRYARTMQRTLITVGLLIALIGLLWPWISRLGLGRLPGDLIIDKPGFKLFAPFTTMIVVSVVVSLIIWLLRR